jgi:ElaB/YqjD/DUF883 family membrane-anchored ribosome-binding protein
MPSKNQGNPQDPSRHNGGAREPVQNVGQRIQEGAEDLSHRVREGFDTTREEAARQYRRAEGMMGRNPTPSVLIGFGIGFGLGLVLTTLLTQPEETWADRYLPDTLRRRVPNALRQAPDRLHDLADAIRDLPDQIARRVKG